MKKHHKKHHAHGSKAHHHMSSHHDGHHGHDGVAHDSHHAANKDHGMEHGFSPKAGYQEGPREGAMGCNEEHA